MLVDMYNKEQKYYGEYETFCFQNCVRQILEYYEVENAFSYINASLSIIMELKSDVDFNIYFDKNAYGVLPSVADGVKRKDDNRSTLDVLQDNYEYIKHGHPIIVTVDGFYLSHLPYYKKRHSRHCMILAGEKNNNPIVIDWSKPWYYKGEIAKEEFLKSRESINEEDGSVFSGDAIKNNWAFVEKDIFEQKHESNVLELFELSKKQYLWKNVDNKYYGVAAYEQLAFILKNIISLSVGERKVHLRSMYNLLYWSVKRKKFFEFYISKAVENELIRSSYIELCNYVYELHREWELYMNFLLKASFVGKEEDIKKLIDKLKDIIVIEYGLFERIEKLNL